MGLFCLCLQKQCHYVNLQRTPVNPEWVRPYGAHQQKGATVDTSNGAGRTLDFVIGKITDPVEMGREEYGELFMYVSNLMYPYLSKMGMQPLKDVGGSLSYKLVKPFEAENLQRIRLMLAKQGPLLRNSDRAEWEVYLTDKGHWVIVLSRRREGDVRIISGKEDFLQYYDQRLESGFIHPWHWIIDAPHFVVDRATTFMVARLQLMEYLEEMLSHIMQRFFIVNNHSNYTP